MRRLLLVSPHFPPSNTADCQRARILLPFFRQQGWEVEVLAVEPEQVDAPRDPWLEAQLPPEVPIHRVRAMGLSWRSLPGLGTLGRRALGALRRTGDRLLEQRPFDMVYFSTTVFETFTLGPYWQRRFGTPFVLDYQDPWVNDFYRRNPQIRPPGGRLKYALASGWHRRHEPAVLRTQHGITAVSEAYPRDLQQRYPDLPLRSLVIPFPAAPGDLAAVSPGSPRQEQFDPHDGLIHWVYCGVLIPQMERPLRAFLHAVRHDCPRSLQSRLSLRFLGTSYGRTGQPSLLERLGEELSMSALIHEEKRRIPYSEVLACLRDAQALMVFGSDDAGYTASKIYPYLLSRRPLLTVCHRDSPLHRVLEQIRGCTIVPFGADTDPEDLSRAIARDWLTAAGWQRTVPLDAPRFTLHTAPHQAAQLCRFFEQCLSPARA